MSFNNWKTSLVNSFASLAILAVALIFSADMAGRVSASQAKSETVTALLAPYHKLHSYQCTIQMQATLTPVKSGPPTSIFNTIKVNYLSPNKLHLDVTGLGGGSEVVSDGKLRYTYSSMTNTYSVAPSQKSPLSMMMSSIGDVHSLRPTGKATVDGQSCMLYSGVANSGFGDGKVTFAVKASDNLVQRITLALPNVGSPRGAEYKVSVTEEFTDQRINPLIPSSFFQFQPPEGAVKGSNATLPSILGATGGSMP
jgi:outer membrane lipoprotein-sorting protein